MKQTIKRCYRILHDNTVEGRYGKALALCTLSSVFQTDFSNWSIFQIINVAWNSAWRAREMKRSSGAALFFEIQMCISCCSDNSIRDILKPYEISPHACVKPTHHQIIDIKWDELERRKKKKIVQCGEEKSVDGIFITHWGFLQAL